MPVELTGEESAVLIAGPTASGKSALALALAEDLARRGIGSAVVNADSMQVYDALRILTARPDGEETARAAHRLYGHVPASRRHSVGAWLAEAATVLSEIRESSGVPIVVGGTGLYFKALVDGLAETPAIPADVREEWRARAEGVPTPDLHRELAGRDPAGAAALRPSDRQRIVRALEVIDATGMPLSSWQARQRSVPVLDAARARRLVVAPERTLLRARIDRRFDAMLEMGALAEVEALVALGLDPVLPVMKAIGVRPLGAHLAGAIPLDAAVEKAKAESRQYAKRQETWFRNQMADWERITPP